MHILIAVDETERSVDAIRTAHRLFGDAVDYTVASIGEPSHYLLTADPLGGFAYDLHTIGANDANQAVEVAELAATIAGLDTADVIGDVGVPGPHLCELAERLAVDVIVIGNHERGYLSRLIDRPVQPYLIHHAPCPVLIDQCHK
jgi:nucleotide-binding universal stress UspA family protein